MVLRDVVAWDDDAGTTPAEIDAADFLDGGATPIEIERELPELLCIDSGLFDDFEQTSLWGAGYNRFALLPSPWPSTRTIGDNIDVNAGLFEDITAGDDTHDARGKQKLIVQKDVNMAQFREMGVNTSWVNTGDSRVWAPQAATDFVILFHNQYKGPGIYPYRGGQLIHVVKTIAVGDVGAADSWANAFSERLDDETPALDPNLWYRLAAAAIVSEGTTPAEMVMAGRFSVIGHDQWQAIFLGSGSSQLGLVKTIFLEDSVPPFEGYRTVKLDTLHNAHTTDDIIVHFWFEHYTQFMGGGGGGSPPGSPRPGPPIAPPAQIVTPGTANPFESILRAIPGMGGGSSPNPNFRGTTLPMQAMR